MTNFFSSYESISETRMRISVSEKEELWHGACSDGRP